MIAALWNLVPGALRRALGRARDAALDLGDEAAGAWRAYRLAKAAERMRVTAPCCRGMAHIGVCDPDCGDPAALDAEEQALVAGRLHLYLTEGQRIACGVSVVKGTGGAYTGLRWDFNAAPNRCSACVAALAGRPS
jgi:hypothetical protein